jgi:hypothetical protein
LEAQLTYQDYHNFLSSVKFHADDGYEDPPKPLSFFLSPDSFFRSKFEDEILGALQAYKAQMRAKLILLGNYSKKEAIVYNRWGVSRYSKSGQRKIRKKLIKRLGHYYFSRAIMVGGTFDPKRISRERAWEIVNSEFRRFMDELNKLRRRRGFEKRLSYFHVIEPQTLKTWMPHFHVVFPELIYLAEISDIERLWGHGATSMSFSGGLRPAQYACKYISKLGENELMAAYMYHFKLRNYSFSRTYTYAKGDGKVSGWFYIKEGRSTEEIRAIVTDYLESGYHIFGISLLNTS